MAYSLGPFAGVGLDAALLGALIEDHERRRAPAMRRLWGYYRNALREDSTGRVRPAQEEGLPARFRGRRRGEDDRDDQKERVIENDIAWRVHAMVDFMFGRPVTVASQVADAGRRAEIGRVLDGVWEGSGGIALLQDMALLGAVYGHVDLLLRAGSAAGDSVGVGGGGAVRVEVVEPTRGIPLVSARDFRALDAFVVRLERETTEVTREAEGGRAGLARLGLRWRSSARRGREEVLEVFSASVRQLYVSGRLVEEEEHGLGETPVAHIQNISQPLEYEGLSEVEPLIPLQDELNTRLSDRAHRVTMQSFQMYLAKGLEGFAGAPIGAGMVWATENEQASVDAIGGDAASPSEESHIRELREAMDKASSVTPIVTGVLSKVGNLSSENALRVTLQGMLTKTARKRVTYGRGIAAMSRMALTALDRMGVFRTSEEERAVRVVWPDPLPRSERERLEEARLKRELGVAEDVVLAELGYAVGDEGVV